MRYFFFAFLLVLSSISAAHALDTDTHENINEYIVTNNFNGFSLNTYLQGLGIENGVNETFDLDGESLKVYKIFRKGGLYEDIPAWYMPYLRSKNHFHNPINNAGFSGIAESGLLAGMSAVDWANQPMSTQSPGGYYSWKDVRNYYLLALTSTDKDTRNGYFAQTFRGVGQLMHLVQDMSVPEHTRDDGHYWIFPVWLEYEQWVKEKVKVSSISPIFYSGQLSSINALFDSGQYDGTNPDVTLNTDIGLSEYTNANFLSWDTMFTGFAHPDIDSVELWQETSNQSKYLRKTGKGQKVEHLAIVSYLYSYRMRYFPQEKQYLPLGMDNTVYSDYASLLLPRAIGYSAGLMKYFFRGDIDMKPDPENAGKYIIVNNLDEAMRGAFSLYYEDKDGNRKEVATNWGEMSIPAGESKENPGKSSSLTFTEPDDIKEQGKYILVYNGTLGNENGAVAGKAVTLEGKWEDWNTGKYTATDHYASDWEYNYTNVVELYNIQTDKHFWGGVWVNQESPDPVIKVEEGKLTLDIYNGNYPLSSIPAYYKSGSRGRMWADDAPASASIAGCQMMMNIPRATVDASHSYNKFRITLRISNGSRTSEINFGLRNVSHVSDWDNDTIWINQGEVTQNLEDAFNHVNSIWHNLGDVNNWRIKEVGMFYELGGKDNHMGVDIDYIDFTCAEK